MPRFASKASTPAPADQVAQAEPVLSFTPTPAAIEAAHVTGADITGMLATLRLQLLEARQALSTLIWLSPPGDNRLRSLNALMKRLCLFLGEVDLHDPSPSGGG
jgi:hypothetical protein